MAISVEKARAFVYESGVLWEKALFGYLFDGRLLEHLYRCWLVYKNPDGGWGHDLEHDIKCPESHPLALEFLLTVGRDTGVPLAGLFDGTVAWLEAQRNADGSWPEEHGIPRWTPYATIRVLLALRRYSRLAS